MENKSGLGEIHRDADDNEAFERIVGLIDAGEFERRVAAFFAKARGHELHSALGNPTQLASVLAELGEDGSEADAAALAHLKEELEQLLSHAQKTLGSGDAAQDVIEREALHARDELCRHWLDMLFMAFESEPRLSRLVLDNSLKPEPGQLIKSQEAWDAEFKASLESLCQSAALTRDDAQELVKFYASALSQHVQHGPLAAPGSFEFVRESERTVLHNKKPRTSRPAPNSKGKALQGEV